MTELFGSDVFYDHDDFIKLACRMAFDLAVVAVIVHGIYFRRYRQRDYVFTYYLFNLITFSLALLLRKVPIELGFALGLFAVFGILRYRTEAIRTRDLTYMFVVIGVALLNALSNKRISVAELVFVNLAIAAATAILEHSMVVGSEEAKPVHYDRLDLLAPEQSAALLADLRARTNLPIHRVSIERIDLLRDTAELVAFYQPETCVHKG